MTAASSTTLAGPNMAGYSGGSASSLAGKETGAGSTTGGSSGLIGISRRGCKKYGRKCSNIEDWAIRHEDVIFKEKIGNGSFGTVFKADYFGLFGFLFAVFYHFCAFKGLLL